MILHGDCLEHLSQVPDGYFQTCVTSPPYWGLRDYGVEGQLGLEKTPDEYVANMVRVFREVRRVLKDDGTVFLNLGDSYFGGGRGGGGSFGPERRAWREVPCGTSGKEPANYQASGCLCQNLCDECRRAYQIGKSHNDAWRDPMQVVSPSGPIPAHTESANAHSPTSNSSCQVSHSQDAISDLESFSNHVPEPPHVSSLTNFSGSSLLSQDVSSPAQNRGVKCQLCDRSLAACVQQSGDKTASPGVQGSTSSSKRGHGKNKGGKVLSDGALASDTSGRAYSCQHCTTTSHQSALKPKDLVGIPWRVAFALQSDGWYLRQDIIWHKPNPMPESVRDRCTKAHEYIFLMSKSPKYYFDVDAIKEPAVSIKGSGNKSRTFDHTPKPGVGAGIPWQPTVFRAREKKNGESAVDTKLRGHGSHCGTTALRHKRSVWSVTTKSFKAAHFATFPCDLIEPCILAGSAFGDYVLDPFAGAGTTGLVSKKHGRKFIGIELNESYVALADKRISGGK